MVIHLKRFYNSTMRREKLNTTVNIPKEINMSEYGPYSSIILFFTLLDHSLKSKAKYNLIGIAHHSGSL